MLYFSIQGNANIRFTNYAQDNTQIILDSKYVTVDSNGEELDFTIQNNHRLKSSLGTPLVINYNKKLNVNEQINVVIGFKTTKQAESIQWVDKDKTLSKKTKYMYLQCQAILCRTFFPCQVR